MDFGYVAGTLNTSVFPVGVLRTSMTGAASHEGDADSKWFRFWYAVFVDATVAVLLYHIRFRHIHDFIIFPYSKHSIN